MPTFEEVVSSIGFLTDRSIQAAIDHGYLIEKGTCASEQIRHASYTLRLGGEVRVARARAVVQSATKEFVVKQITPNDPVLELCPGDTALLYCIERLRLPDCILGFTVARGLLFAEALAPENTYVDPGFTGSIYTTVTNISDRTVRLQYAMPIARIFFYRLTEPVEHAYRTGAAMGIAQQLESVHLNPLRTADDCKRATDLQLLEAMKLIPLAGLQTSEAVGRLSTRTRRMHRLLLALVVIWPTLLVLANGSEWVSERVNPFVANIVAGLCTAILVSVVPKIWSFFTSAEPK
jgi:Deoxycytidine deaminase